MVATGEVTRQVIKENPDFAQIPPLDYARYLVISLGTGTQKQQSPYDAKMAAKWGVLGWLVNNNSTPLIESFLQASADLVVFHNNIVFEALSSVDNYLRIQVRFIYLGHALTDTVQLDHAHLGDPHNIWSLTCINVLYSAIFLTMHTREIFFFGFVMNIIFDALKVNIMSFVYSYRKNRMIH